MNKAEREQINSTAGKLLENKDRFVTGLCNLLETLELRQIIDNRERTNFEDFMEKRMKSKVPDVPYYWEATLWQPRERWLNSVISGKRYIYNRSK